MQPVCAELNGLGSGTSGSSLGVPRRYLGIDLGAETLKLVEVLRDEAGLRLGQIAVVEHGKKPGEALSRTLADWDWERIEGAVASGRFAGRVALPRIPTKQAQLRGYRFLFGNRPATVVNIGSQGFSVLEIREGDALFRENSRCSQGTGNFLRQLVERFSLSVEEAGRLCVEETQPAALSGRCPVILKTDMTHLANKGEDRIRILAGLFDAVCDNVLLLVKPGISPAQVVLVGGVGRCPRVRRTLAEALRQRGMELLELGEPECQCLEAIGCAVAAAESPSSVPAVESLIVPAAKISLERLPGLGGSLSRVKRMAAPPLVGAGKDGCRLVVGLDIGSTGSKLVGLDIASREVLWEGYRRTLGDPVGAAQDLLRQFLHGPVGRCPIVAFGATGSGREVVGSLLLSCFGRDAVFIVNEIVAHAAGALHYDPRVDTIFEIGGQDAKYIRLADGRVTDCAMNEACSAGTGSFIEEQGGKFAGIRDVAELGREALAAPAGVSLGQHCSVFMAEVIDEAVASGAPPSAILSGLYDSIIQNYLNRVKANRSIGKVIFCQGMPFAADALAAAVARQTGCQVIVPPNPGTVGALGIALLAVRELQAERLAPLDCSKFLDARVEQKDSFVCRSTSGCGGAGNRCRIERLRTCIGGKRAVFTWGGGCALHDRATRKRKLTDLAPDPFREREELIRQIVTEYSERQNSRRIALTDEFMLKGLLPFFAGFFHQAGLDLEFVQGADRSVLRRGIQLANTAFCAPMQLFHGVAEQLGQSGADFVFVPMLRSVPGVKGQPHSSVCPIVQASPDLLRHGITGLAGPGGATGGSTPTRVLAPQIDFGQGGLESAEFVESCRQLGRALGLSATAALAAWKAGVAAQRRFESACQKLGERALAFCREKQILPVVVMGRAYTIYHSALNSNVPAILREQGAIGIPVDCYPIAESVPVFGDIYWGYAQQILRAAHQVRRTTGVYGIYCSNYSCGPDSFNLHFVGYVMEGKPWGVIETDGHCGDAGTRTRVEAFLHCAEEHRRAAREAPGINDFSAVRTDRLAGGFQRNGGREPQGRRAGKERFLVPWMGPSSEVAAALLSGFGLETECLPPPDGDALRLGRRYTSGKECLPLPLTLGTLLRRLERAAAGERFVYVQPAADGPCRFGVYHLLDRIILDQLGWRDRLRIWSPKDDDYFRGLPGGAELLMFSGCVAADHLLQARLDVRPFETLAGATDRVYERWQRQLIELLRRAAAAHGERLAALWQALSGDLFGIPRLLDRAGQDFAALRGPGRRPVVELTGEIYVRGVEFSNDDLARKLEARGLSVRLAPASEWLAYCGYLSRQAKGPDRLASRFGDWVQRRIEWLIQDTIGFRLGWPAAPATGEILATAEPYVSPYLLGEAPLTVGSAVRAWRRAHIDAVINVGPLECMPSKIAEAQFYHVARREGLLALSLSFDGSPVNEAVLDNFAFEVRARFEQGKGRGVAVEHAAARATAGVGGGDAYAASSAPAAVAAPDGAACR
jgi:predicted CoA-substrate-specific enzyme activase